MPWPFQQAPSSEASQSGSKTAAWALVRLKFPLSQVQKAWNLSLKDSEREVRGPDGLSLQAVQAAAAVPSQLAVCLKRCV